MEKILINGHIELVNIKSYQVTIFPSNSLSDLYGGKATEVYIFKMPP